MKLAPSITKTPIADIALVCGVLSVFPLPIVAGFLGIILGHIARYLSRTRQDPDGQRKAKGALILSYASTLIYIMLIVVPVMAN